MRQSDLCHNFLKILFHYIVHFSKSFDGNFMDIIEFLTIFTIYFAFSFLSPKWCVLNLSICSHFFVLLLIMFALILIAAISFVIHVGIEKIIHYLILYANSLVNIPEDSIYVYH